MQPLHVPARASQNPGHTAHESRRPPWDEALARRLLRVDDMTAQPSRFPRPSTDTPSLKIWPIAILVGQLVAIGEVAAFAPLMPGPAASILLGAVAGIAIGAAQWPCLHSTGAGIRVVEWIPVSALGGALIGALAVGVAAGGPYDVSSIALVSLAVLAFGSAAGALLGGTQAWALRRRSGLARRWIAANTVGWSLGLLIALHCVLGTFLTPFSRTTVGTAAIMAACFAATAFAVAAATALALRPRRAA